MGCSFHFFMAKNKTAKQRICGTQKNSPMPAAEGFTSVTLATLLCADTAKCSACINKAQNRTVEFFSLFHKTESLSVALGVRHCKIACLIFIDVPALYLSDDGNRLTVKSRQTADDSSVVAEESVAVHLIPVGENLRDIILYMLNVFYLILVVVLGFKLLTMQY